MNAPPPTDVLAAIIAETAGLQDACRRLRALCSLLKIQDVPVTGKAEQIIREVAELYNLDPRQVRERGNFAERVAARREVYLRLRALGWSLPRIGRLFGQHHTTVLHALRALPESRQ